MLDALRPQKPELEIVRVGEIVARLLPLMEYAARRDGVRLTSDVPDTLPSIVADPKQLQQVLINLLVNAIEAVGPEGTVGLRAEPARRGDREGVAISVTDTGPGIPVEHRAAVFRPFFTTKPRGKGTGLGLSICRDIVKEHGGEIAITVPGGGGTTFVVWLPAPAGASA